MHEQQTQWIWTQLICIWKGGRAPGKIFPLEGLWHALHLDTISACIFEGFFHNHKEFIGNKGNVSRKEDKGLFLALRVWSKGWVSAIIDRTSSQLSVAQCTWNPRTQELEAGNHEFKTSLVYRVTFKPAWATQWDIFQDRINKRRERQRKQGRERRKEREWEQCQEEMHCFVC